jgi:hypothetical protein
MTDDDDTIRLLDQVLRTLHAQLGNEVQASLVLRTGETVALAHGELTRVSDPADSPRLPTGDDPVELWLDIGAASFGISVGSIQMLSACGVGDERVGIDIEMPLYELTIHWPR